MELTPLPPDDTTLDSDSERAAMKSRALEELKILYDLGFALHWLRPKSKVPLRAGWTKGPRVGWDEFAASWKANLNVGVRLGEVSRIGPKYLAVIDCDVKSSDPRHRSEMEAIVNHAAVQSAPRVITGRGFGSAHIYVVTDAPVKGKLIAQSDEVVKTLMPSVSPSADELASLSELELSEGWRLRPAWEVQLMGEGRQTVLPPSVHPDTLGHYIWGYDKGIPRTREALPLLEAGHPLFVVKQVLVPKANNRGSRDDGIGDRVGNGVGNGVVTDADIFGDEPGDEKLSKFTCAAGGEDAVDNIKQMFPAIKVDLKRLDEKTIAKIKHGEGVVDRSKEMFWIARTMLKCGYTMHETVSALSDKHTWIGKAAWDRRGNASGAADWVYEYSVLPAMVANRDEAAEFDVPEAVEKLSEEDAAAQAEEVVPKVDLKGLSAAERKEWILGRLERAGKKEGGNIKPSLKNTLIVFENYFDEPLFINNAFAEHHTLNVTPPWVGRKGDIITDDNYACIRAWLTQTFGFEPLKHVIFDAKAKVACDHTFHPVRDYLDSLKWDGVPRIDTWLEKYLMAETTEKEAYVRNVGRKLLVALVARVMDPGCKFDYMVILKGAQGIRKSTVLQVLMPNPEWFTREHIEPDSRDGLAKMRGRWLLEVGELSSFNKTKSDQYKAFITRESDEYRELYGMVANVHKRQSVFVGTTNDETFLKDPTGNRRYWVIDCMGKIDTDGVARDRDQLFAEAYTAYLEGEKLYLTDEVEAQARDVQDAHTIEDSWEGRIAEWLVKPETPDEFTISALFAGGPLYDVGTVSKPLETRAGCVLTKMGLRSTRPRVNGHRVTVYRKPK